MSTRSPAGLATSGRALWRTITETYELRADELRVLEQACREADLIDRLQKELGKGKLTTNGSMGQLVAHPLVQELRQHRAVFARLLAQLKLPDDPGEEKAGAGERASAARAAAEARWKRGA